MRGGGDFWSRRKAAVAAEADAELQAQEAALRAEEQAALEKKSDDEILKELDLPDPDTLGAGDDFAAFMKQAVPERLRRRALRRLWVSNPVLANLDALVDYGEDYTDAANVIENLQSTYVVGKGMLAHVEEMARQAEEAPPRTRRTAWQRTVPRSTWSNPPKRQRWSPRMTPSPSPPRQKSKNTLRPPRRRPSCRPDAACGSILRVDD